MSKKTISKIIAVICVMAMCFTVIFTGAVSAETRSATCAVTGDCYEPGAKDSYVIYTVTFTSGTPFTAGSFSITAPSDLQFVDCSPSAAEGGELPEVYLNVDNNKVLFAGFGENSENDIRSFTSLSLRVKFNPSQAIKDQSAGKTWGITINSINITNTNEETYTCADATGSAHVHNYNGTPATADGVTSTPCSITGCTAVKLDYTGETGDLDSNTLADTKQAALNFTEDGDTVLVALVPTSDLSAYDDVYFVYSYKDDDDGIKTATSAASGTKDSYTVFPCGRNGGIGRMNRNIKGNFIAIKGTKTTISADWEYSVKTYLESVINDPSKSEKDKNYCKALWNYGYYTTEALGSGFASDFATYTSGPYDIEAQGVASDKQAIGTPSKGSLGVNTISVTTGYKPKMNFTLKTSKSVTVSVYTNSDHDTLVYKKTLPADTAFTVSDIPTKYITGDIVLSDASSTFTYSFGRYAKAREGKSDANVFKWMMSYGYYLNAAFA